jgi:hypothetical protein
MKWEYEHEWTEDTSSEGGDRVLLQGMPSIAAFTGENQESEDSQQPCHDSNGLSP